MGRWKVFAAGDESHTAGSLVNHRCSDCLGHIIVARGAAGIDETGPAHVTVHHLIAGQVDGVVAGQICVDLVVRPPEVDSPVAAVVFGPLLLAHVGLDGDRQVVGLPVRSAER